MNKRGGQWWVVGRMLLVLIIAVILYFVLLSNQGLVHQGILKVNEAMGKRAPKTPDADLSQEIGRIDPVVEAYENIHEAFARVQAQNEDPSKPFEGCLINYQYDLEDMNDYKIELVQQVDGIHMVLINEQEQRVRAHIIPNKKLCVVGRRASDGRNAAQHFYEHWLAPTKGSWPQGLEYSEVSRIDISEPIIGDDKELVMYGRTYDAEDKALLYMANAEHVCFFVTYDGWDGFVPFMRKCDADEEGLDDDCIDNEDEYGIATPASRVPDCK